MSLTRLIIGPIPSDYSPESDIVLSPHSFVGQEDKYPNWADVAYPESQFDHYSFLIFTDKYLNQTLMPRLVSFLNQYHGTTYEVGFWRTLIMPFVLEFWGVFTSCYLNLRPIFRVYFDQSVTVDTVRIENGWHFIDQGDFCRRAIQSPSFSHWILSEILGVCGSPHWVLKSQACVVSEGVVSNMDMVTRRFHGVQGFSEWQHVFFSIALGVKSLFKSAKQPLATFSYTPDSDLTQDVATVQEVIDPRVLNLFQKILFENLPKTVLEDFSVFQKQAQSKKYKQGAVRVIQTSFSGQEYMKFYMANAVQAGEIVVGTQHGGSYGVDRFHYSSFELEIKARWFLSWGWHSQEGMASNIYPIASPRCTRYWNKHLCRSENIIFVGTQISPLGFGSLYSELFLGGCVRYVQDKCRFIAALSGQRKQNLKYRGHPGSGNSLDEIPILRNVFSDLRICEGDLMPQILSAELVVMDNPSTTLNYLVVANVPFVLFLSSSFSLSKEAQLAFDLLREAKVLFDTPEAAAHALNGLEDIAGWWATDKVQLARKNWMQQFARPSKHVFWEWLIFLWDL